MKKKFIILMIVLIPSIKTFAQNKIDKFCTVRLKIIPFDVKKVKAEISFGEEKSLLI
jgi:hypothetical protein